MSFLANLDVKNSNIDVKQIKKTKLLLGLWSSLGEFIQKNVPLNG